MAIGADIFWLRKVVEICNQRLEAAKSSLCTGEFKDFGGAQYYVGYIRALEDILAEFEDLRQRVLET